MKKILFTPGIGAVEALGGITRLIAIADEIKKIEKDCRILFRSAGREAEYAKKCGYKVISGYKPKFDIQQFVKKGGNNEKQENSAEHSVLGSCDAIKVKGFISKEYVENTFKEEVELVESFKPDIIIGEFEMVMPIVAKKMNIPYFCTGGTPNEKDFCCYGFSNKTEQGYAENYNELLKTLNLRTVENVCEFIQGYNADKIFVPSIPKLEDFSDSEKYMFLGSLLPKNFVKADFNFEKKRPLIYVYLSVGGLKPDVYQKMILDTFSGSEFDVIVTGGGALRFSDDEILNNDNVHFMNMVPSDKVLEIADIAIHHCGQNTTVQCIENQVPSIIFPGNHFERYYNAEKASEIGCAINSKIDNFNKEYLLKTCRKIMKDNTLKENLKMYSDKIKSYGGAYKAAEFIINY